MKKIIFFCWIIIGLLFVSCSKKEYESFGTLYGVVLDNSNDKPLANATVVLNPGGETQITDGNGHFEFPELTPQQYTITVQKAGYKTNRKNVSVVVDERIEVNVSLDIIE